MYIYKYIYKQTELQSNDDTNMKYSTTKVPWNWFKEQ